MDFAPRCSFVDLLIKRHVNQVGVTSARATGSLIKPMVVGKTKTNNHLNLRISGEQIKSVNLSHLQHTSLQYSHVSFKMVGPSSVLFFRTETINV